ncbi:MAG: hypothetical protein HZA90_16870 [Verrucomicrobia bacterium]|nr:hypothetical protein [Verrucomicrobiota bacterium]
MSETIYSTGGFRRVSRRTPLFQLRLVLFAVALVVGVLLWLWMQASVGRRMAQLQQEFGAIRAEGFYVGVHVRTQFRKLNDVLLTLHLEGQATNHAAFLAQARELKVWMLHRESVLANTNEQALLTQLEAAYARYVTAIRPLLSVTDTNTARVVFANTYEQIHEFSRPVLEAVARLVQAQQATFDEFARNSQRSLAELQQLLTLSLVLLLGAVMALALLIYRGLIAPLHRRLTESQAVLQRQEKLAALGTLAAGVAHEIRNPLTAIKLRLFTLKKSLPSAFAENEDAFVISGEINRLDRIVKDFLQFARPSEPETVRVPAERILQEVRDLLQPSLNKSNIQLKLAPHGSTWVRADTQQIKQAMINLIQNSAESIGRDGQIHLRVTRNTETVGGGSRPAAVLQVTDTGRGIPPEVQQRLFDPFFSTKEGGTGLGLAIAARIVEKHGGLLRYRTELNCGTTFEIVLPRLEDHATENPDC